MILRVKVRREDRERCGDRTRADDLCDFEKILPDHRFSRVKVRAIVRNYGHD